VLRRPPPSLTESADWFPISFSHSMCCGRSGVFQPRSDLSGHHCRIEAAGGGVL